MYAPMIINAVEAESFKLGLYEAHLLKDIQAQGHIRYLYVLQLSMDGKPCLYISSEENAMAAELGGGSHFLCAFEGDRHLNFGCSDQWADLETFKAKAIEMAKERLSVS